MVEAGEVVRGENLSLHDREVDLHLIQPAGVDWPVHEREPGKQCTQPLDGRFTAVRRSVIDDPEDTSGIVVGRASHDLFDQTMESSDAGCGFAAAKDAGMVHVERGHISPGAATLVFMLDTHGVFRGGQLGWVLAVASLNAGLFVGRDDKFILLEGPVVPAASIQIQYPVGLNGKGRIAGEDPTAVIPGPNCVLMKPTPNGASGDCRHQTRGNDLPGNIGSAPAGQRKTLSAGQFAGEGFNLHDQFWGEKPGGDPGVSARRGRPDALRKSACATY